MMVGRAEGRDRRQMLGAAIAAVSVPPIALMPPCKPAHQAVAHRLGDDAGRGDRVTVGIAVDQGVVCVADLGHVKTIHKEAGRRGSGEADKHTPDRSAHGERGRDADVQVVDLANRGPADADGECGIPDL